jgi:hypothetical protein
MAPGVCESAKIRAPDWQPSRPRKGQAGRTASLRIRFQTDLRCVDFDRAVAHSGSNGQNGGQAALLREKWKLTAGAGTVIRRKLRGTGAGHRPRLGFALPRPSEQTRRFGGSPVATLAGIDCLAHHGRDLVRQDGTVRATRSMLSRPQPRKTHLWWATAKATMLRGSRPTAAKRQVPANLS